MIEPDMKLYLISQTDVTGWDTYNSAVVSAVDENDAKKICPGGKDDIPHAEAHAWDSWTNDLNKVTAEYLGETDKPRGVICASFNAG